MVMRVVSFALLSRISSALASSLLTFVIGASHPVQEP